MYSLFHIKHSTSLKSLGWVRKTIQLCQIKHVELLAVVTQQHPKVTQNNGFRLHLNTNCTANTQQPVSYFTGLTVTHQ